MSALMIKDLSVTEELGSKEMQTVRGGYGYPILPIFPSWNINDSTNVTAEQLINQGVTVNNVSGNNDAFTGGSLVKISPSTFAQNNVTVNGH